MRIDSAVLGVLVAIATLIRIFRSVASECTNRLGETNPQLLPRSSFCGHRFLGTHTTRKLSPLVPVCLCFVIPTLVNGQNAPRYFPTDEARRLALEKGSELAAAETHLFDQRLDKMDVAVYCDQVLIAEGDSWLEYPGKADIVSELEEREWLVISRAHHGDELEDLLYEEGQLFSVAGAFYRARTDYNRKRLRLLEADKSWDCRYDLPDLYAETDRERTPVLVPKGILVSAGGNDLISRALLLLLEHGKSSSDGALNNEILDGLLRRMSRMWIEYVAAISEICQARYGEWCNRIPILIHGYDYAKASGDGYQKWILELEGPWLKPTFDAKRRNGGESKKILKKLIDEYNELLCVLATEMASETGILNPVSYLDFRGLVGADWEDELHPKKAAAKLLAEVISERIVELQRSLATKQTGAGIVKTLRPSSRRPTLVGR